MFTFRELIGKRYVKSSYQYLRPELPSAQKCDNCRRKIINVHHKLCGYELLCTHKFEPEDKTINGMEGEILGREKLIHHIVQSQKDELKMNIKEYMVEF